MVASRPASHPGGDVGGSKVWRQVATHAGLPSSRVCRMRTEIEVALIAGGFAVIQVVVSYLTSRQTANDLRTNIGRDIEIVRKLRPDSDEVARLESHIAENIADLITRDERRARLGDIVRSIGPALLLAVVAGSLTQWLAQGGVSDKVKGPVDVIILITGPAALVFGSAVLWRYLRYLYWNARLSWRQATTWWAKRATWKAWHETRALVEQAEQLAKLVEAHKAEIIAKAGQEAWDKIAALIEEMKVQAAKGQEIETQLKALDERYRRLRSGELPDDPPTGSG